MRILLVDDSGTVVGMLRALLESLGHTVETARDGREGFEAVATFSPEVVISDLRMPGMDGLELVGAIRDRDPVLPVIIFTDEADVPRAVEAMRRGAFTYVVKGAPVEKLLGELDGAFAHRNRLERARILERERGLALERGE